MSNERPWYAPGAAPAGIPRRRSAGEQVWRLVDRAGRVQTCEVRDDRAVGAGFDVLVAIDGEPQFSRRCADRPEADYVATALRQDAERGEWQPE